MSQEFEREGIAAMEDQEELPRQITGEGDIVVKEAMSLESVRELMNEEQGYDAPFATFTWRHWLDLQARAVQCFSRFVRAIEEKRPDHGMMIGLEMQEIATSLLLESYAQSANVPLEQLPIERAKHIDL